MPRIDFIVNGSGVRIEGHGFVGRACERVLGDYMKSLKAQGADSHVEMKEDDVLLEENHEHTQG